MAGHFLRLPEDDWRHDERDIMEDFTDELLLIITSVLTLEFEDIMNYLVSGYVPQELNS